MFSFGTAAAFAQEAQQTQPGAPGGAFLSFLPLIAIFVIFYFLLIRPQQKKQRQLQQMLKNLQKGDRVVTTGGIYGTILSLTDNVLTLQVDEKVKIRVSRSAIAGLASEE